MSPALMGRPFSVERIVLAYGAEDPRFEPGRWQRRCSSGRYKWCPMIAALSVQHSCRQTGPGATLWPVFLRFLNWVDLGQDRLICELIRIENPEAREGVLFGSLHNALTQSMNNERKILIRLVLLATLHSAFTCIGLSSYSQQLAQPLVEQHSRQYTIVHLSEPPEPSLPPA